MQAIDVLRTWGFVLLGVGLVLVAFLVNRFAPAKRRRIRRALLLYVLFLICQGAAWTLARLAAPAWASWAEHARLVSGLLASFASVDLVTLAVFDLALPTIGVTLVAITSDILVGFAYLFAALGVLKASGLTASSVVTTSAVVSGVLALSMQATLGNILGGVALQLDGSIHVGDWIQLPDGTQGKVHAIRWRHTVVETRNWDTIIVPNANLLAQNIVILGKREGQPVQHRMWVYFNVDFRHSPSRVIDVVRDALWAAPIEGVARDPKPSVICFDFARDGRDSFGYYAARYWLTDLAADDPTSSRIRARIHSALKRAGIPLARPAQTLFVQQEEEETAREMRHLERQSLVLEHVGMFDALTNEERAYVAARLKYAPFTAGETVTKQGAVAHWLYILTSGKVEVRRRGTDDSSLAKTVATIDAPSFFGEMGLLAGEPRNADVVAVSDVECYRLDKEGLAHVLGARPDLAEQFSQVLARRRVELEAAREGLDEEARKVRMRHAERDILYRIQEFFGLARTTKL